jgi:PAS domain S-box-containing protein
MNASRISSDAAAARAPGADIIDSIDVPILAVGANCSISSFNSSAAALLSLSPADLGRPLAEIPLLMSVKRIEELCGEAIGSGASSRYDVHDARNGSWFVLRIAPYIGSDGRIDGAVLALQNVTAFRASLEQAIYEREYTKAIINTVSDPLVVLDEDCQVQAANQAFYTKFRVSREEAQGARIYDIGNRDWEIPRLRRFLEESDANNESDAEFEHEFPTLGHRTVLLNARRLSQRGNLGQMTLLAIHDITERKQREEAQRRAEEELRDFVETAAIGMHWVGPDGKVLWANQTELNLLGYTHEEYIGHHIAEFHANLRVADDILARLRRGENLQEYPARLRCKNGSIRQGLVTSSARFDGGKFVHTRCFTRDITEQVHAEEQRLATERTLRENDSRFREMIDALPVPIYTTDAQGRLTHFNPACVEFSGRTPDLGTDQWCVSWKLFWPDGQPMLHAECPMAIALREGRILSNVEAVAERPDGTRITFVPYPTPLRDADGRIVGGINMLLDITERKRGEIVTASLAAIVESSDDAIIGKDLNGVITSWNKSAERLFGYTAQEAIGQSITMLLPADRQQEEPEIIARLKRGERIDHFETVRVRKDGTMRDISLTISPVKNAAGRIVGASKVARDITERKKAEKATKEKELSARLLKLQDEERRRIARELHDGVGQLLAAMSMNASRLDREKSKLSPDTARCAEENAQLIQQVSADIRTVSYLLHPPLLDEMGLHSALKWFIDGFSERSNISANLELPADWERLPQDYELCLFRIAQECLTNIHRHSGSPTASVRLLRSPGEITLEVSDQGTGVNQETQAKISSGETAGVGLRGMRERIMQLGGSLEIRSDGHGTTVIARVPFEELARSVAS